jgi:hypothetical protein
VGEEEKVMLWLALIGMLSVVAVAEFGGNGDFTVRRWVYVDFGGTVMVDDWTQDYEYLEFISILGFFSYLLAYFISILGFFSY